MELHKLSQICDNLYDMNLIPLVCISESGRFLHPELEIEYISDNLLKYLLVEADTIVRMLNTGQYMIGYFSMLVEGKRSVFIIGPVNCVGVETMSRFPIEAEGSFREFCSFVYLIMSGVSIKANRIDMKYTHSDSVGISEQTLFQGSLNERRDANLTKDSYQFELNLLRYVRRGDKQKIRWTIKKMPETYQVDIGLDANKYKFVGFMVLLTRDAIHHGVPLDIAFSLSDAMMEHLHSDSFPTNLFEHIAYEFSDLIQTYNQKNMSLIVRQCVEYITSNINHKICLEDLSFYTGKSKNYISSHFKSEMGINISDYILNARIEEAKDLLLFTNHTYQEISSLLSFNSQSYFVHCFKGIVGMTPKEYRLENVVYL